MQVIGTKSGKFHLKRINIQINNNEPLTNIYSNNLNNLNLEMFPVVNDLEILITIKDSEQMGKHISFYSASRNEQLTTFPWWDFAENFLKEWSISDIPTGTINHPFEDVEQGWQIIIFEDKDFIYVLEGGEFENENNTIHTWYRTPKKEYYIEWNKLLEKCK